MVHVAGFASLRDRLPQGHCLFVKPLSSFQITITRAILQIQSSKCSSVGLLLCWPNVKEFPALNSIMATTIAFQALSETSASLKPSHKFFFPWHHAISVIEAALVIQEYSRSVKFLLSCLWHWANFKSAGAFLGSSFSTSDLKWPDKRVPRNLKRISVVICHDFSYAWITLEVSGNATWYWFTECYTSTLASMYHMPHLCLES